MLYEGISECENKQEMMWSLRAEALCMCFNSVRATEMSHSVEPGVKTRGRVNAQLDEL